MRGETDAVKLSMLEKGSVVGSSRIVRPVGRGGMGEVYEVEHVRLGVRYALKAFALEGPDGAFLKKRFLAEGRLLARIDTRGSSVSTTWT